MSAYKFKGWENIDGSSVTREETDSAFKVVMHSAREIEAAYQVRQKTVKRAKVMRIMMYAAAALILIASPLAIYHMMDHEETDLSHFFSHYRSRRDSGDHPTGRQHGHA